MNLARQQRNLTERAADADRLADALRDVDYWRDRAHTAEQDAADAKDDAADARNDAEALQGELTSANHEIDRLKNALQVVEATALPRLSDQPLVSTGSIGPLIGEALDTEIGGGGK